MKSADSPQATVSFCSSTSSPMPLRASTISSSKRSWLNGAFSAVPCTSTMPPDAGHDEVGVGVGVGILGVVEIEHRRRP